MDINNIVKAVESSEAFKNIDPDHYLVHIFRMMDSTDSDDCQVGYYLKKSDKVTVFEYDKGDVKSTEPQEAFKEKKIILPLRLENVKMSVDDALTKTDEIVKNNYPSQMLLKAIVLLQNIPDFGLIWNMTVITHTFNVINIKINAETSQVIRHSMESLLQWKKE
ncbi:TPA: hypothetical protein HA235_03470 [Candidatus Woesearchaeota archaeon]|nr:hypothetical protein [Candidatus Woesearchaeota archaeon]HIH31742.1 hypothetical protein [Candidatus Woesearchaeota archaeon]HIH54697.1 hypothetical protein [Candidatus Woesearchaeota archaeon]HIJ02570.1 hypothetical protein [Candidatus Woesearchaeota archaeon]HIJ13987.1 hypothetical protein [Candidatus Woesearchaeota archaeon]